MAEHLDVTQPFTSYDASRCGVEVSTGRGGSHRKVLHGIYVGRAVELTPLVRARAALKLHLPTAHVSHTTAAEIMGLPVPTSDRIHVTAAKQEERRQHPGVACHVRCAETAATVEHASGLRIPSPDDLFIELAGVLPLVDLVVAGDAMVRRGLFTADELRSFCSATRRWHSRRARRGARLVRDSVDSPMETRLRLLLVLAGLPEPVVNHVVRLAAGERRIDLAFPDLLLAVEYDGRHHIDREDQWVADLARREQLEALGWRFVVVTSDDLYKRPAETLSRVVSALSSRGRRVRRLDDAWRAHFTTY